VKIILNTLENVSFSIFNGSLPKEENLSHIYLINSQNFPISIIQELQSLLNKKEIQKALKFRFDKDRIEYVVSRGILRILISKYLRGEGLTKLSGIEKSLQDISPQSIQFEQGAFGKPRISNPKILLGNRSQYIKFNVSHSNGRIAIAFCFGNGEIGIDIEKIKKPFDYQLIIDHYFSKKEQQYILSEQHFYELWTRKEALLKVTGIGLTKDLTNLEVSENSHISYFTDKRLLPFKDNTYYINSFQVGDYSLSLALEKNQEFRIFEYPVKTLLPNKP
jgi:4'-phosphopantetheinyl transferase